MAKNSCPNVGQLDKALMHVIDAPASGVVGTFQLGAVDGSTEAFLFPATKGICGKGLLQLVACDAADRDLLAAAADGDAIGLSVTFFEDDGTTIRDTCARAQTAADGGGLCHASYPLALPAKPGYGLVEVEITLPAGLSQIAIAWTPDC